MTQYCKPLFITRILGLWLGMLSVCQAQDQFLYISEDSPGIYGNCSGVAMNVAEEGIYILERYFDHDTSVHYRVRTFDHSGHLIATKNLPKWNKEHGYDTLANGQKTFVQTWLGEREGGAETNIYAHNTSEGFYLDYYTVTRTLQEPFYDKFVQYYTQKFNLGLSYNKIYPDTNFAQPVIAEDQGKIYTKFYQMLRTLDTNGQELDFNPYEGILYYSYVNRPTYANGHIWQASSDMFSEVQFSRINTLTGKQQIFRRKVLDSAEVGVYYYKLAPIYVNGYGLGLPDGSYVMQGEIIRASGSNDVPTLQVLIKIDSNGTIVQKIKRNQTTFMSSIDLYHDSMAVTCGISGRGNYFSQQVQFINHKTLNATLNRTYYYKAGRIISGNIRFTGIQYHQASGYLIAAGSISDNINYDDSLVLTPRSFIMLLNTDGTPVYPNGDITWDDYNFTNIPSAQQVTLKLSLYPNPSSHSFTIKGLDNESFGQNTQWQYSITSLDGKKWLNQTKLLSPQVTTEQLPKGMYILHLQNSQNVYTLPFVKN